MFDIEQEIKSCLNQRGRLDCKDAFKVAKKNNIDPKKIVSIADKISIKIDNCQLGSFGQLEFNTNEKEILNILEKNLFKEENILCDTAWKIARGFSLNRVGSTMVNNNLTPMYCQLGCFEEMKRCKSNKGKPKDAN